MARRGPKPKPDHAHGTRSGYVTHKQRGTDPCGPCSHADAVYKQDYRKRGRCAPGLGWPLLPGKEASDG